MPVECRLVRKHPAGTTLRIDEADGFSKIIHDKLHWGQQIRVATDDDSRLVAVQVRVMEQMGGKVDVGAFLIGAYDLDEGRQSGNGRGQRHGNDMAEKVPVM